MSSPHREIEELSKEYFKEGALLPKLGRDPEPAWIKWLKDFYDKYFGGIDPNFNFDLSTILNVAYYLVIAILIALICYSIYRFVKSRERFQKPTLSTMEFQSDLDFQGKLSNILQRFTKDQDFSHAAKVRWLIHLKNTKTPLSTTPLEKSLMGKFPQELMGPIYQLMFAKYQGQQSGTLSNL